MDHPFKVICCIIHLSHDGDHVVEGVLLFSDTCSSVLDFHLQVLQALAGGLSVEAGVPLSVLYFHLLALHF